MSKYSFNHVKVGLDVANGAAWQIAKGVFDALGAKTYVMNDSPDRALYNEQTLSAIVNDVLQRCGVEGSEVQPKFELENGERVQVSYLQEFQYGYNMSQTTTRAS